MKNTMIFKEYPIFQGISLIDKEIHSPENQKWLTPQEEIFEIAHCQEGSYEVQIGQQCYPLAEGDFALCQCRNFPKESYCSAKHYHGISIQINLKKTSECLSCVLDGMNICPAVLVRKFCSGQPCFIFHATEELAYIFSGLYTIPENVRMGYLKIKVLEVLLFLNNLDISAYPANAQGCSYCQVQLAKAVCEFVHEHMDEHFTIEELAEKFNVSPARLKMSFRNVYHNSVYACFRKQKMLTAAKLLQETDRTVLDIAGECGYDNGSKFSKAFRDVMGVSPREFRKGKISPAKHEKI